jgi:integrase
MACETYALPPCWDVPISAWAGWLVAGGASAQTVRVRRGIVRSIARRLGGAPQSVSTGELVALCGQMCWSADHRRNVRASLNSFYGWACAAGSCAANPAAGLPRVAPSSPHPRPVTDAVWAGLLDAAGPREQLMARLAAEAGLRRAEVAAVHADDLVEDLYGHSLIVRGKGDRQRLVPLTGSLAGAVRAHARRGFLFPGQVDGHISANHVGKLLSRLMPPGWSAHKLRHRYASRGFAATGDLLAVQQALGHASVATTQRYVAVSPRSVRAVSEAAA